MATILDGKILSNKVKEDIRVETEKLGIRPGLAVVLVGDDPASTIYVRSKEKACQKIGFYSEVYRLPEDTPEEDLLAKVNELNRNKDIHGILVQLPLPDHINEGRVIDTIDPAKDVDCFHPYNFGRLFAGNQLIEPCTPKGIMLMVEHYGIKLKGKNALIIGRSNIVGKPIAMLLMQKHATITIAHSRTQDLPALARQADILVPAIGKPEFITGDMVKEGAVIFDVGINRVEAPDTEKGYRVVGDVAYEEAEKKASAITPVPGGVGALTIAMLLSNTLQLAKIAEGKA